jgi:hypothetical protein
MLLGEAKKHLEVLLHETMPVFLMGKPGIGKSSIVKQIVADKDQPWKNLIDLRLSLLNPIDLRGLPYLDKEKREAVWLKPEFLPSATKEPGILFLDEINIAPVATQQAAYELLLDRRIGSYIFPDNWRIIAAGNREDDGAQVNTMPTPLANRMIHLDVEAELDDWKSWAIKIGIDERIIAFLNFKPDYLSTLPKKEEKSFPTPRSWEFVSKQLALYNNDVDAVEPIIEGTIGKGAAKEFYGYMKVYHDLPDIDGILKGKVHTIPNKNKTDVYYALCSSLVLRLKKEYLANFIKYTMKFPDAEFATLAIRDAAKGNWSEDMLKLPEWDEWSKQFGEYLE